MGLDMFMSKKLYVWSNERDKVKIEGTDFPVSRPKEIVFEAAYWRKANHIHKWFVDNVQDGNDDCGNYCVPLEKLKELLKAVDAVIENPDIAPDVLPTQGGFFFGDTSYDSNYMDDLVSTKNQIEAILNDPHCEKYSYEYHSSW